MAAEAPLSQTQLDTKEKERSAAAR